MNGTYWVLDSSRTVTWSTANTYPNYWRDPSATAVLIDRVLGKFKEVANIDFMYRGHYSDPNFAPSNMVFTGTSLPWLFGMSSDVLAWAYFPNELLSDARIEQWFGTSGIYPDSSGDVWINWSSEAIFYPTYVGSDGFFLLLHEIGHAVGLKHPHDNGGTGWPTATQVGLAPADIQLLTVMSYNEGSPVASWWGGNPGSLMPFDILALQYLYGVNNSTRADGTTYALYDDDVLESYWDAGGTDLATAINSWTGWTIDLGLTSNVYGHTIGFATPNSSETTLKFFFDLENAVGSPYSDFISGNDTENMLIGLAGVDNIEGRAGNDVLWGGLGNDTLHGGSGLDVAYFTGNKATHAISKTTTGFWLLGPEGADIIVEIERLEFADIRVALDLADNQAAGNTVRLIGAGFDAPSIAAHPDWVAIGLNLFDAGYSMLQVADVVLQAMGPMTNSRFVDLVYENVVGIRPSDAEKSEYVSMLIGSGGHMRQAELLMLAANTEANETNVNLIGLQQQGVEYV